MHTADRGCAALTMFNATSIIGNINSYELLNVILLRSVLVYLVGQRVSAEKDSWWYDGAANGIVPLSLADSVSDSMSQKSKPSAQRKSNAQLEDRLRSWLIYSVIAAVLIGLLTYVDNIKDRWYIFDPAALHDLARTSVDLHANDTRAMVNHIVSTLAHTHGAQHINVRILAPPEADGLLPAQNDWFLSNAGGAMGAVYVIHASLTEYLMIFGTPLGTEGHTGRYLAEDYFHILQGEQWAFSAGSLEKEVYKPGSVHVLPRGAVQQYKMHEGCWAFEYARGWIPLMLPFGLADSVFSTLDFITIYNTARVSAREMLRNLLVGKL